MSTTEIDDLFGTSAIADPYTHFARVHDEGPVYWNERFKLWLVTGYDEIVWLLRHPEYFSSAVMQGAKGPPFPPVEESDLPLFEEVKAFRADQLVEKDRPEHAAMRGTLHKYFTPNSIEEWRPFVRTAVHEILDGLHDRGRMDVLTDLAAPLPVRVIAEMMDVPYQDRDHLRQMADSILHLNRGEPTRLRPLVAGIRDIVAYAAPLVEQRIDQPGNDFVSVLARGERDGIFDRHQVLVNTGLLLFAGHETTMNLIANGLLAFIRHPEQWAILRDDPAGRARWAVEECLRFDPPVKSQQRACAEDVELAGQHIRKGDRLRWVIARANREPSVFPHPDRFDITRQPNPHLSFGAGIHYCLGAALSRVEGQEVFRALAERFDAFELDTETLEYQPSIQFRSLKALPVTWKVGAA